MAIRLSRYAREMFVDKGFSDDLILRIEEKAKRLDVVTRVGENIDIFRDVKLTDETIATIAIRAPSDKRVYHLAVDANYIRQLQSQLEEAQRDFNNSSQFFVVSIPEATAAVFDESLRLPALKVRN